MVDEVGEQGILFTEAEILRDDFLSANDGNKDAALLAACQNMIRLANELDQARHFTSVGYLRKPR
ncbi:MAG: hypothetical protein AAFY09_09540 [Pseudomonadota bacterium]